MKNIVPIVFTFDNNLVMPAGVCITSLVMNADEDTFYDIFILHSDKCDFSKTPLIQIPNVYKNCKIQFRVVHDEFISAFEIRGITTTAYYRLLIPDLIPEYDKIMYSDVDVIFREDLLKYYKTDLTGFYMAGVDNASAHRPDVQSYVEKELHIDCKYGHFYSGNLILNSALIRKDNLIPKFRELAKHDFTQQDMDIINIACYGKIKPLSPAFCLANYLYEFIVRRKKDLLESFTEEELQHAIEKGIVHYNGPKPWKENTLNMDIWWYYYRKSIFFDEEYCLKVFEDLQNKLERLSLLKRVKILIRYFIYGRK